MNALVSPGLVAAGLVALGIVWLGLARLVTAAGGPSALPAALPGIRASREVLKIS